MPLSCIKHYIVIVQHLVIVHTYIHTYILVHREETKRTSRHPFKGINIATFSSRPFPPFFFSHHPYSRRQYLLEYQYQYLHPCPSLLTSSNKYYLRTAPHYHTIIPTHTILILIPTLILYYHPNSQQSHSQQSPQSTHAHSYSSLLSHDHLSPKAPPKHRKRRNRRTSQKHPFVTRHRRAYYLPVYTYTFPQRKLYTKHTKHGQGVESSSPVIT